MNIGEAMLAVRDGKKVKMNDKGQIVYMVMGQHYLEVGDHSEALNWTLWDYSEITINRVMMESTKWEVVENDTT